MAGAAATTPAAGSFIAAPTSLDIWTYAQGLCQLEAEWGPLAQRGILVLLAVEEGVVESVLMVTTARSAFPADEVRNLTEGLSSPTLRGKSASRPLSRIDGRAPVGILGYDYAEVVRH